jgi:hypothetical protein
MPQEIPLGSARAKSSTSSAKERIVPEPLRHDQGCWRAQNITDTERQFGAR